MFRSRRPLLALPVLAGFAGFAGLAGGCQLLIGLDGGTPGTGGAGGSTSSSTSASSSASSSGTSSSTGGTGGTGGTASTSSSTGAGGSGGSTSSSSSSSGMPCTGMTCGSETECPDPMNECVERTCDNGCCGTSFPGHEKDAAVQMPGDCLRVVCDGAGATTSIDDDGDAPTDSDACHMAVCSGGSATQMPRAAGTPCSFGGGKVCGDPAGASAGLCIGCNVAADCAPGMACIATQCAGTVLLVAAGAAGTLGGEHHPGGAWATTSLGGSSTDELALAITSSGKAVAALRVPLGAAASEQLWFATWTAGASFVPFAAINAATIFARTGPSIAAASPTAQLVFHGTDFKHYDLAFDGTAWSAAGAVGAQTFGPTPAAIAAIGAAGADASIAYFDGSGSPASNTPTAQDRVAGVWQAKVQLDGTKTFVRSPALVAMTAGADLMVVYARADGTMWSQTRTGTSWSTALAIPGALILNSSERPALAALPGGGAIMAFRGDDGDLYYATYSAGVWTGATVLATPNVSIVSMPSLAHGAPGAMAEIAFVKTSDKAAYHARLVSGAWTTPALVGGANLSHVAIAAAP